MIAEPRFLTAAEFEEFSQDGRFFVRLVGPDLNMPQSKSLTRTIGDLLRMQNRGEADDLAPTWLKLVTVNIAPDDGMSWSAEHLARFVSDNFKYFNLFCLSHRNISTDTLPILVDELIPRRRFFKLLRKSKVLDEFKPRHFWFSGTLALLAALAAGIASWLELEVLPLFTEATSALGDFLPAMAVTTVAGLLGLGVERLREVRATSATKPSVKEIARELEEVAGIGRSEVEDLVKMLAAELGKLPTPRIFIVDNFGRLDYITKQVIHCYLSRWSSTAPGSELWVFFSPPGPSTVTRHQLLSKDTDPKDYYNFFQFPLSKQKREELSRRIGHEDRSQFTSVKMICRPGVAVETRHLEILKRFSIDQSHVSSKCSSLDLLYLLSLNSSFGFPTLEHGYIVSALSVKSGLRASLLELALPGTRHLRAEIDSALRTIANEFAETPLVQVEMCSGNRRYTISPEAERAFARGRAELSVPEAALAQAFWSVYWFDNLRTHPLQAFWVKKLGDHLLATDVSLIEDGSTYERALERILEAYMYTIEAALEVCVFSTISDLIERAVVLTESDFIRVRRTDIVNRVKALCWEAYSILGLDVALAGYVRLLHIARKHSEANTAPTYLASLSMELLPLAESERASLLQTVASGAGDHGGLENVAMFGELISARLALLLAESNMSSPEGLLLSRSAGEAKERLLELIKESRDRLVRIFDDEPESITNSDLVSITYAFWSIPYLLSLKPDSTQSFLRGLGMTGDFENRFFRLLEEPRDGRMETLTALLDLSEITLLIAERLEPSSVLENTSSYLRLAVLKELYCSLICSIAMSVRIVYNTSGKLPEEFSQAGFLEAVDFAAKRLALPGGVSGDLQGLITEASFLSLASALEQLGFLWHQFEIPERVFYSHIARIEVLTRLESSDHDEVWKQSLPLRRVIDEQSGGFDAGPFLAQLALSNLFAESVDLKSDFFLSATRVVHQGPFGSNLKRDLAILAIGNFHHVRNDLTPEMQFLLAENHLNEAPLRRHLKTVPNHELTGEVLGFINAARNSEGIDLLTGLSKMIISAVVEGRPPEVVEEVEALLDYSAVVEKFHSEGGVDPDEALAAWENRKDSWTYAALLNLLLSRDARPDIVDRGLEVISSTSVPVSFNTYLFLALKLAKTDLNSQLGKNPSKGGPLEFLAEAIPQWENDLTASINAEIFMFLSRFGQASGLYNEKAEYWSVVKFRHDEVSRLNPYLKSREFCAIFLYYFELLEGWGLETDIGRAELYKENARTSEDKYQRVVQWVHDGAKLPKPVSGGLISSQFVILARCLFDPKLRSCGEFEVYRKKFNELARPATVKLLKQSSKLAGMPDSIKGLLGSFLRRYDTYSLPEK